MQHESIKNSNYGTVWYGTVLLKYYWPLFFHYRIAPHLLAPTPPTCADRALLAKRVTELTTAPLYPTWPVTGLTSARTRPTSRAPFTRGPRRTTSVNCSIPASAAWHQLPPDIMCSKPPTPLTDAPLSCAAAEPDAPPRLRSEATRAPRSSDPPSPPPIDSLLKLLPDSRSLALQRTPGRAFDEDAMDVSTAGGDTGVGGAESCCSWLASVRALPFLERGELALKGASAIELGCLGRRGGCRGGLAVAGV